MKRKHDSPSQQDESKDGAITEYPALALCIEPTVAFSASLSETYSLGLPTDTKTPPSSVMSQYTAGFDESAPKNLPDPLPVPPYSREIVAAQQKGTVPLLRSIIIRETAEFFQQLKPQWKREDFERIAAQVAQNFPQLHSDSPGAKPNTLIRNELSTYCRRIRRKQCMQANQQLASFTPNSCSVSAPSANLCEEKPMHLCDIATKDQEKAVRSSSHGIPGLFSKPEEMVRMQFEIESGEYHFIDQWLQPSDLYRATPDVSAAIQGQLSSIASVTPTTVIAVFDPLVAKICRSLLVTPSSSSH